MPKTEYKILDNLMHAYLNMDAQDITGADDLEGMVEYYFKDCRRSDFLFLKAEMAYFEEQYKEKTEMQTAFDDLYPNEVEIKDVQDFFKLLNKKGSEVFQD